MQRSCPERIYEPKDPLPSGEAAGDINPLDRAARIADVKDRMLGCLEELDRLQLAYAANYLCHAIELVEDRA